MLIPPAADLMRIRWCSQHSGVAQPAIAGLRSRSRVKKFWAAARDLGQHPSKIDADGGRHYLIRAIPYQDPQQEAERLKAVDEPRVNAHSIVLNLSAYLNSAAYPTFRRKGASSSRATPRRSRTRGVT